MKLKLCLLVVPFLFCCQSNPNIELAKQVQAVYETSNYLELKATVYAPPYEVHGKLFMSPNKVRTEIVAQDFLALFIGNEGEMTEAIWTDHGLERRSYKTTNKEGTSSIRIDVPVLAPYKCLIGTWLQSWVGTSSNNVFLKEAITQAEFLADREIEGHPCFVLLWDRGKFADYHRQDVFYIDKETKLLRRWDTLESGGEDEPLLTRSRFYTDFVKSNVIPEASFWDFENLGSSEGDAK